MRPRRIGLAQMPLWESMETKEQVVGRAFEPRLGRSVEGVDIIRVREDWLNTFKFDPGSQRGESLADLHHHGFPGRHGIVGILRYQQNISHSVRGDITHDFIDGGLPIAHREVRFRFRSDAFLQLLLHPDGGGNEGRAFARPDRCIGVSRFLWSGSEDHSLEQQMTQRGW